MFERTLGVAIGLTIIIMRGLFMPLFASILFVCLFLVLLRGGRRRILYGVSKEETQKTRIKEEDKTKCLIKGICEER